MEFNFSILKALKESWSIFKTRPWFFIGMASIMLIINAVSRLHDNVVVQTVIVVAAVVWSYVWLSISFCAVDGKTDALHFKKIRDHLPTFHQFLKLVAVGLLTGVIVVAGFIMLIIPGVYFMVRLIFSNFAFIDRQGKITDALKYSWTITKGEVFWTVFLVLVVVIALYFVGMLAFMVGMLVAYPLSMLILAKLYRALGAHHSADQQVSVQASEIVSAAER